MSPETAELIAAAQRVQQASAAYAADLHSSIEWSQHLRDETLRLVDELRRPREATSAPPNRH